LSHRSTPFDETYVSYLMYALDVTCVNPSSGARLSLPDDGVGCASSSTSWVGFAPASARPFWPAWRPMAGPSIAVSASVAVRVPRAGSCKEIPGSQGPGSWGGSVSPSNAPLKASGDP